MSSPRRMKNKVVFHQQYTLEEQKKIIEYVISQREFYFLRGNTFWKQMKKKGVVDRTWQSVKEHFRKRIMENLHLYNLPPKDIEALRNGWCSTSQAVNARCGNPKYKRRCDFPDEGNYEISDSDESSPRTSTKTSKKTNNKNTANQAVILSDSSSDAIQIVAEKSMDSDVTEDLDISPKKSVTASTSKCIMKVSGISGKTPPEEVSSDLDEASGLDISRLVDKYCGNKASANVAVRQETKASTDRRASPNLAETSIEKVSSNPAETSIKKVFFSCPRCSKNGFEDEIGDETLANSNATTSTEQNNRFSNEEDIDLLTFITDNKSFLQNRNSIAVYEFYKKLHGSLRSPRTLRKRFLKDIFPNIDQNDEETPNNLENRPPDKIPNLNTTEKATQTDNFNNLENRPADKISIPNTTEKSTQTDNFNNLENRPADKIPNPNTTEKATQTDNFNNLENRPADKIPNPNTTEKATQTDNSSNLIEDGIHPVYCRLKLRGDHHIFAGTTNENQEKIAKKLSRKFRISPENFHAVNYDSNDLSKLGVCFRKALLGNRGEFIKACLDNENDLEALISNVEICVQPCDESSENSCSESEDQVDEYMHLINVKQEIILEDSINNLVQIKEENCSFEHNFSHFDEHNYCRNFPQSFVKEEIPSPCSTEILDTSLEFEAHLPDSPEMPTS